MATLSKEEYLKRYLSNSDPSVKKKRKKKIKTSVKCGKSLIIDDDVNLIDIEASHDTESQEKLLELAEDVPLIFDETGTTMLSKDLDTIRKKEEARKAMWAPVRNVSDEEMASISPTIDETAWSPTKDFSPVRRNEQPRDSPPGRSRTNRKSTPPDLSPPRKGRSDSPHNLGRRSKGGSSDDHSPPRRRTRHDSHGDLPPQNPRRDLSADRSPCSQVGYGSPTGHKILKRKRHDSPDLSSTRINSSVNRRSAGTKHGTPDLSPLRKTVGTRNMVSSDQSPPRRKVTSDNKRPLKERVRHDTPDHSPPRRTGSTSPDLSPPRRKDNSDNKRPLKARVRNDTSDIPLPRRTGSVRANTSPDLSPPRRKDNSDNKSPLKARIRNDTSDIPPPRRTVSVRANTSPDLSPPRRKVTLDNERPFKARATDLSPPRHNHPGDRKPARQRTRHDTPDQSPPRRSKDNVSPKRERQAVSPDLSPKRKGPSKHERKAGLHSAAELRRENELSKRRADEIFSRMASSSTGKGAETVHRDKKGRKRDLGVEEAKKKEEERKKLEEDEKFMEWGKGLQQTKNAKDKVNDEIYEMSKPLARYKDDEDLEEMLREKDRSGDPMLAFLQQKKTKRDATSGKKEKPRYKGPPPPPNRFSIHPGYRWDGVDRSNGFEKKRFSMLANKGSSREEAYKWSTEDM